ncbi:MAG: alpha-L-rhamnosidase [Leifsonia xyli]|nr:MAG: alpha-L-rhamnosidase [Leifsonia xyli]
MSPSTILATRLTTELRAAPLGIDEPHPEFGWRIHGAPAQSGYELEVRDAGSTVVWQQTGGERSFGIRYAGTALTGSTRYLWRVRLGDGEGRLGAWSADAPFETALLDPADWSARWIGHPADAEHRPIYLRHELRLVEAPVRARAYVSALGWHRLVVGGHDLTGSALVPRFTAYDREVEYRSYDLDGLLAAGTTTLGIVVADGRFRGALGIDSHRSTYGDRLGAIAQLRLEYADGRIETLGTDGDWLGGNGPLTSADPKFGTTIDLRIPDPFADAAAPAAFTPVELIDAGARRLVAERIPPFGEQERLPVTVRAGVEPGTQLIDVGRNIAGVLRLRLDGPAGTRVTLQHSEDLRADGSLAWEHLDRTGAAAKDREQRFQRDEIVLDGSPRTVQPAFTFHGFRYVLVSGLDRELSPDDVEAIVLSSDTPATGVFRSSDSRLDRLWEASFASLRGNFLDTATDCPTRERAGFTGDAQVFAPASTILSDTQAFFRRYLATLALEQLPDGSLPTVVPSEYSSFSGGPTKQQRQFAQSVGWGDASVFIPAALLESYGDERVFAEQYDSMRAWVDYLDARARRGGLRKLLRYRTRGIDASRIVDHGFIWGEWVRAGENGILGLVRDMQVNRGNIATAYLSTSSRMLADAAGRLGRQDDAAHYTRIADDTRAAWRRAFVRRGGARIGTDKQDDYVRALAFELLPDEQRQAAVGRLVELIRAADTHLGTGFLSTPMLLPVLADGGHPELAYELLLRNTPPSWLAQIEAGATTIHENWRIFDAKGERTGSSNHYAFGSVVEWMASGIAGIRPDAPGYRRIRFSPVIGGGLTHASATISTPYGEVGAGWRIDGDRVRYDLEVPPGTTAWTDFVDGESLELGPGTHTLERSTP